MKTINISKELNIDVLNNFKMLLNPDFLYIPIDNINFLVCKKNQKILKEDILYKSSINTIYSPVSGKVKDIIKTKNKYYLLLKNDFMENSINEGKSRRVKGLKKDLFLSYVNNDTTRVKLSNDINTLYINCIDNDPYIFNKYMYLKEEMKDILNFLQNMADIFHISNIILVLKDEYQDIINEYSLSILESGNVSYKIINGVYPIGNNDLLNKHLIKNKGDILLDLNDINELIYDVKKNRKCLEKYITINGDSAKNRVVLKVKKYSLISYILKETDNNLENVNYILNNSLCGRKVDLGMDIVLDDTLGIIINGNNIIRELPCNNCGLCVNVCPYKLNPLVKNKKCNKCGLCNYVCPHKINIVERFQK